MGRRQSEKPSKSIDRYTHDEKQKNRPEAGLVSPETDPAEAAAEYDPPPAEAAACIATCRSVSGVGRQARCRVQG